MGKAFAQHAIAKVAGNDFHLTHSPTKEKSVPLSPAVPKTPKREKGSGKSSNPDYVQSLAYVKKETLKNVQRTLFDVPEMDYSDLIERLLSDWLKKQK